MALTAERESLLNELAARLHIEYVDRALLNQAFLHLSFLNERDLPLREGNERLEFLGDAVLGLIVTDELFRRYGDKREGELSKVKSVVVSRKVLAERARQLKLGRYILFGKGEEQTGGRTRKSILANTFESLVGVLFLSGGLHPARRFVLEQLEDEIDKVFKGEGIQDYKSRFQELVQRQGGRLPRYRVTEVLGPDHDKLYRVEVYVEGMLMGAGEGKNKKSAEQDAARQALDNFDPASLNARMDQGDSEGPGIRP